MQPIMRTVATASIAALILLQGSGVQAQTAEPWPSRRVALVVGYAAGGFADGVARIIARKLSERWKQPVVVQNMAGAGGNLAARSVSIAAPDGYTLLGTTTSLAINETLYRNKGFTSAGLAAIAIPVEAPELLASNPKSGIHNYADMLKVAREGKLYMGTSGIGSGSHISAEYFFKVLAKVDVKHIPFPGGNPAMLALMTGDINIMASTATAIPSILNGELTGIAVGSAQRSPMLPNVPTHEENGFPGFRASSWAGFFAPSGTPDAILDTINADVNDALTDPEVQRQFHTMGLQTTTRDRAEVVRFFNAEIDRWGKMVSAIGLTE
ncbi:MAG: extra-cytoplasmic solute receptor [Hyphomicrobiales bacterium]|nr:extra-cytoplasmic solute receptor [Hyphomicrobiales bacterium]